MRLFEVMHDAPCCPPMFLTLQLMPPQRAKCLTLLCLTRSTLGATPQYLLLVQPCSAVKMYMIAQYPRLCAPPCTATTCICYSSTSEPLHR